MNGQKCRPCGSSQDKAASEGRGGGRTTGRKDKDDWNPPVGQEKARIAKRANLMGCSTTGREGRMEDEWRRLVAGVVEAMGAGQTKDAGQGEAKLVVNNTASNRDVLRKEGSKERGMGKEGEGCCTRVCKDGCCWPFERVEH